MISYVLVASLLCFLYTCKAQWTAVDCPNACVCEMSEWSDPAPPHRTADLNLVDCGNLELKTVPKIPQGAQKLELDNNRFEDLDATLRSIGQSSEVADVTLRRNKIRSFEVNFTLANIVRLNLDENEIATLDLTTLNGFPNLQELSLQGNNVSELRVASGEFVANDSDKWQRESNSSLGEFGNLRVLRLDSNKIDSLGWLNNSVQLRSILVLSLAGNVLKVPRLGANSFSIARNLSALILTEMRIRVIDAQAFENLFHLQSLDLDGNDLETVPTDALAHLVSLRYLNLNGNKLFHLNPFDFYNLPSIETIDLTQLPRLTLIDDKAFCNLPQLRELLLYNNHRLTYVAGDAFVDCPKLETLDLHNTMVEIVSPETQRKLTALRKLYLGNNPINCNCMMMWAKRWLPVSSAAVEDSVVCASPPEFRGSRLVDVHVPDALCAPTVEPTFPIQVALRSGEFFQLPCRAFGNPVPSIQWILPGGQAIRNLTEAAQLGMVLNEFGTLTSQNFTDGSYTCIAQNQKGMASRKVTITISEPAASGHTKAMMKTTSKLTPSTATTSSTSNVLSSVARESTSASFKDLKGVGYKEQGTSPAIGDASRQVAEHDESTQRPQQPAALFTVPKVRVLSVSATSALITWTNENYQYLQNTENFRMSISIKHNERLIYENLIEAHGTFSELDKDAPEYNVSFLEANQIYSICLTLQCCSFQEKQSCTELHTREVTRRQQNHTAILSIIICIFILICGAVLALFYGLPSFLRRLQFDQYERLEFLNKQKHYIIPMNELQAPLLKNNSQDDESSQRSDNLIDTSASVVYM